MSGTQLKCVRLPEALLERLDAMAKANGIKMSAAIRVALQHGLAMMEREAAPPPATAAVISRRKIISKGVF